MKEKDKKITNIIESLEKEDHISIPGRENEVEITQIINKSDKKTVKWKYTILLMGVRGGEYKLHVSKQKDPFGDYYIVKSINRNDGSTVDLIRFEEDESLDVIVEMLEQTKD